LTLLAGAWLDGQDPATPQAIGTPAQLAAKIAFMNFSMVLEGTEEAQVEISNVRSFMDQKQAGFDSQSRELEQLRQQFTAQERTLNVQTRAEMQASINEKQRQLQRFQEDTQLEINKMRDGLFARLSTKIQPLIDEYAREKGIAAIFFLDQIQGYFNPALDVTQEIIRIYNDRFPVAGAPAAATPPPTPPNQ
jgi:outer membrane protein